MRRGLRISLGILLWASALFLGARLLTATRDGDTSTLSELGRFFGQRARRLTVTFPRDAWIEVGDDVEVGGRRAGEIEALLDPAGQVLSSLYGYTRAARIRLHDAVRVELSNAASARLVRVPQTAAWVVQTLFTAETVPKVAEEWNQTMLLHREEIFALVTPIVRDVILDLERHIEAELPGFLERHRDEIRALSEGLEKDLKGEDFAAVFEKEIWPIAQPKVRPIIEEMSREIWEKLPLWRFATRLAYQTLPLTDNDHLQRAWVVFLEEQVVPIIRLHSDEIVQATREVAREALAKPEVTESFRRAFSGLLSEPRFHQLAQAFLRELILDNGDFHRAMLARWRSPEVERAVAAASTQVEPMVRRMGDILLGTRQEGITREFARVLRSQILLKDLQRIEIDPGPVAAGPLAGEKIEAVVEWELRR